MTTSPMAGAVPQPATFSEGRTYLVRTLHHLDPGGQLRVVEHPAVIFTAGWVYVQEAEQEGYVVPRDRVLLIEGVKRPRPDGPALS